MIIPHTKDLEAVARRLVWFKPPKDALDDPYLFIAHVMTYGTLKDVSVVKKALGMGVFKETLFHLPPGIMDIKSWTYWTLITDFPQSSMPERRL
jgi:hypothetical protein